MLKKGFVVLAVLALIPLFLFGCASERGKPSRVIKAYYDYLLKRQYEKAYELILPQKPPAIEKSAYLKELSNLEKNFELKEYKIVGEEIKGDKAEVIVEITELNKKDALLVTSQAKISLKKKGERWHIVWPKKSKKK